MSLYKKQMKTQKKISYWFNLIQVMATTYMAVKKFSVLF